MPKSLTTTITAGLSGVFANVEDLFSSPPGGTAAIAIAHSLGDGNGDDEANRLFADKGTIALNGDVDLDLFGGVTDIFGDVISFSEVKAILLWNRSDSVEDNGTATTAELGMGGGDNDAGNAAFDTWITSTAADGSELVIVPSGGFVMVMAPNTGYVCAAASDELRISNRSGADQAAYRIIVVGVQ